MQSNYQIKLAKIEIETVPLKKIRGVINNQGSSTISKKSTVAYYTLGVITESLQAYSYGLPRHS